MLPKDNRITITLHKGKNGDLPKTQAPITNSTLSSASCLHIAPICLIDLIISAPSHRRACSRATLVPLTSHGSCHGPATHLSSASVSHLPIRQFPFLSHASRPHHKSADPILSHRASILHQACRTVQPFFSVPITSIAHSTLSTSIEQHYKSTRPMISSHKEPDDTVLTAAMESFWKSTGKPVGFHEAKPLSYCPCAARRSRNSCHVSLSSHEMHPA